MRHWPLLSGVLVLGALVSSGCSNAPGYSWTGGTWTFSPNGTLVAYLAGITAADRGTLTVQPVGGGNATPIASNVMPRTLRFSPDGTHLAFEDGNSTLWVAPLTGGTPVQIAAHAANLWFTPDSATVLFEQDCADTCVLARASVLGGAVTPVNPAVASYVGVAGFSADGQQLVISDAAGDLWTLALSGGTPVHVAANAYGVRMTPDGHHVTFMTDHTLHVAPVDGSGSPGIVLATGANIGGALFSPDGTHAVFFPSLTHTLIGVSSDGQSSSLIATEVNGDVAFSPTGKQLAIVVDADPNGFGTLETVSVSGGTPTPIAQGAGRPQFLPDGRMLFLAHWDPNSQAGSLYMFSGTGAPVKLADGAAIVRLSPDGQHAALGLGWDTTWQRGTLATSATAAGPAVSIDADVSDFQVSPDGLHVGFVRGMHPLSSSSIVGVGTLEIAPIAGGSPVKIADQG